jgi:hypothetical protein
VHPLCLELMLDFHPTSEVINLFFPLFQSCLSLLIRILSFSAGYSTCPSCQNNLLQYRRLNLCLGISIPYSGSTDVQICHTGSNSHQFSL